LSFPARYQLPSFTPYRKAPSAPDLDEDATTSDFRAIAAAFHAEFFAEHPDTEIFANLVKLILAKIFDERQRRAGEEYVFQVLQENGREESAAALFARIAPLYEAAYKSYIDSSGGDSLDPKVFAPDRVKSVVKGLQSVAVTRGSALHGDVIGTFFEEILRAGFKQDKGMYFTHANLVWFMLEALDIKGLTREIWKSASHPNNRMPYVIDPSCGSGAFLLRAMQMMSSSIREDQASLVSTQDDQKYFDSHLADSNPNEWAKDFLYGCDPKFVMAITAKVNMVLHGDGSAHIFKWDSLSPLRNAPDLRLGPATAERAMVSAGYGYEVCEQFDVVVSNPPFGITLSPETRAAVPSTFSLGSSTSSESLFLERWAQLLKPKGRLGVVVPESLLNGAEYLPSRLLLYRYFWIRAIVSLPRNLFIETPTLTSLLFAQKKDQESIVEWDARWADAEATVGQAAREAKEEAQNAADEEDAIADAVEKAFLEPLRPFLDPSEAVIKRGRRSEVLPLKLPAKEMTPEAAREYYLALLKTAGFKGLLKRATFAEVASELPQEWTAYAIDDAGYKLSKRGERVRPNQLCRFSDEAGLEVPNVQLADVGVAMAIDTADPARVLDFIRRDVAWA
jgi:type I restriction enzyme M protein